VRFKAKKRVQLAGGSSALSSMKASNLSSLRSNVKIKADHNLSGLLILDARPSEVSSRTSKFQNQQQRQSHNQYQQVAKTALRPTSIPVHRKTMNSTQRATGNHLKRDKS